MAGEATTQESGRYRYVRDLAEGGMGKVEIAVREEARFRRVYAVKRLKAEFLDDPDLRAMFLEEARIAGLLRHPNLVGVIDTGEDERGPFLVMDFVEGVPLSTLISRTSSNGELLPVQLCVNVAKQVAEGLQAAHDLRDLDDEPLELVHRDVSPQNIILGFDGVARLTDFGIAKALGRAHRTSTGILKGKSGYFSPEQLQFEEPDRRSDIFCLGIVLYELLSGKRLYGGDQPMAAAKRILKEPPPDIHEERQDVHPMLVKLLFEMLAKDRVERPQDARAVERQLDRIANELAHDEDPIRVADFVNERFSDLRDRQREELRSLSALTPVEDVIANQSTLALAKTELATPADPAPMVIEDTARDPVKRSNGRWYALGAAALAVIGVAGLAVGLGWFERPRAETRGSAAAERAPRVVPAAATAPAITIEEPPRVEPAPVEEQTPVERTVTMRRAVREPALAPMEEVAPAILPPVEPEMVEPTMTERRNQELMTWPEGPVSPRSSR
jgi:serine/threonine protein kinase